MICMQCKKYIKGRNHYTITKTTWQSYIVLGNDMGWDKEQKVEFCSATCLRKWCSEERNMEYIRGY